MIDSDVVIDYIAGEPSVVELIDRLIPAGIALSVISYMEVYEGVACHSRIGSAVDLFALFVQSIPPLPVSLEVVRRCAAIRHDLRTQVSRVNQRALDLLVAATALVQGLTLVTRNTRDFRDIPGLDLYQENSL